MFNPSPTLQSLPLGGGDAVYVIDDVLIAPDTVRAAVIAQAADFADAPHNAYPGPELPTPAALHDALALFFAQHCRARLGGRRTERVVSRFALATCPPEQLLPKQWICHRDRMGAPPTLCIGASVLYLFDNSALGGTAFYRPLLDAAQTARLVHDSCTLSADDFAARYAIAPGYLTQSNPYFEQIAVVPARSNRMIVYDGTLFHTSHLTDPSLLSADPAHGRLTLNGFYTCTRRAT